MSADRKLVRTVVSRLWLNPLYFLTMAGVVFCVAVVASTIWIILQQRQIVITDAGINLRNLSRAVADQTDRVIESLEIAEDRLLDHLALDQDDASGTTMSMTGSRELHVLMHDIISGMSEAYGLVLIDPSGKVVNFSYSYPIPDRNIADRAYFQFAMAHPEVTRFVGETVANRQTGRLTFYIVRRLTTSNGIFKGIMTGAVQVDYLMRLFSASTLAPGGAVALFRNDGSILARYPGVPLDVMQGHGAEFRTAFSDAQTSMVRHPGVFDGEERLTAVSDLPRHPLQVAVSAPLRVVLAAWRMEAAWISGIAAVGCLVTIITAFLTVRRFQDRRQLEAAAVALQFNAERQRVDRVTAEQQARYKVALDNMKQGLVMFDHSNVLLLANAPMLRTYGFTESNMWPGMTLTEWLLAQEDAKLLSEPVETVIKLWEDTVRRSVPVQLLRKLSDGRQINVNFIPFDEGWILTNEDVTDLRKADAQIAHMAMHDALTDLPNRVMLRIQTEEALAAMHSRGGFAIVCLDLDHFKDVNDALGHPAGDKLLCEVATRIRLVTRQSDIVVRLGGDEFAVVVYPGDNRATISKVATRLVEAIGAPYTIDGQMVFIATSIGIAMAPADGTDPDTLMKNADLALYRAKSNGRDSFAFFEPAMEQHLLERRQTEMALRDALELGELELHYQPIVKVSNRRIIGFEALMRWRHSTRGMVPPSEFIPIVEENGFIIQIGEWALNTACQEAAHWPDGLKVAVNLSSVQFRSGRLVETIATALRTSRLEPGRLELEITESTMMMDAHATLAILNEIKALGVRIAMDDFGTGYSSLAYLQRFPFDKVKIDRAFVRDIKQTTNLTIIRAVISIAENMGIQTTAEGVETEEQFARVAEERCDEVQGYLFSRPRPSSQIREMLIQENASVVRYEQPVLDDATP